MGLKKLILNICLFMLKPFMLCTRIHQNRITFISLTSDKLTQDFRLIHHELEKTQEYDIRCNLVKYEKNLVGNFLYMLNCFKQLYQVHTSRLIIINDNNYVISKFKRKGVQVLQVWHACGAVKKFGNQIEREYEIDHYDYVLSNANAWQQVYSEAFQVAKDHVLLTGLPRVDVLSKPSQVAKYKQTMIEKYPILKDKYIILYAPTFRGNIIKGFTYEDLNLDHVLSHLPKDTILLYKMHPLLDQDNTSNEPRIINVHEESLNALLSTCDCLITDYSSIVFDYSLLHKKVSFYVSDLESYQASIGFNLDYLAEMPGNVCLSEEVLIEDLKVRDNYSIDEITAFQQKYMFFHDGRNGERVVAKIHEIMNE